MLIYISTQKERPPAPTALSDFERGYQAMHNIGQHLPIVVEFLGPKKKTIHDAPRFCRRDNGFGNLALRSYSDALEVLTVRQGSLADFSERLVIPFEDRYMGLTFHRESFNEDIQVVPSASVDLIRFSGVMSHPDARQMLFDTAAQLELIAQEGADSLRTTFLKGAVC